MTKKNGLNKAREIALVRKANKAHDLVVDLHLLRGDHKYTKNEAIELSDLLYQEYGFFLVRTGLTFLDQNNSSARYLITKMNNGTEYSIIDVNSGAEQVTTRVKRSVLPWYKYVDYVFLPSLLTGWSSPNGYDRPKYSDILRIDGRSGRAPSSEDGLFIAF